MKKYNPRRIVHILLVVCAIGILYSAFFLLSQTREYAAADTAYEAVRQLREAPPLDEKTAEKQEAAHIDFASLEEINPEVVAWVAGAEIDYPIVQGKDNAYYLGHLFSGEANQLGAIFMDYRNQGDFSDKNTVIYGHNMKNGSMFSSLTAYKAQDYYDSNPTMMLYMPDNTYQLAFFAGLVIDGNGSVPLEFADAQAFQGYIDALKKKSTFQSTTTVGTEDRIVTLCTCSYEFNNARYALFGKLTPLDP